MKKHVLTVIGVLALGLGLYAVWLAATTTVACPTWPVQVESKWATGTQG